MQYTWIVSSGVEVCFAFMYNRIQDCPKTGVCNPGPGGPGAASFCVDTQYLTNQSKFFYKNLSIYLFDFIFLLAHHQLPSLEDNCNKKRIIMSPL